MTCKGKNVHPGTAKGKMVNAAKIAMELNGMLPAEEAPEHTEGYEGFFHLTSIEGDVEVTELRYIIRDHDRELFEGRKAKLASIVEELQGKYGAERIVLQMKDQYYNMREKIEPVKEVVDIAQTAMEKLGIKPIIEPIRGDRRFPAVVHGTADTEHFTGGENYHGRYEYVSADNMVLAVQTIIEIVQLYEAQA